MRAFRGFVEIIREGYEKPEVKVLVSEKEVESLGKSMLELFSGTNICDSSRK